MHMDQDYRKAKTSALGGAPMPNYPEYPYYGEAGYFGGGGGGGGGFPFGQQPVPFGQSAAGGTGFSLQEIKNVIDRMGGIDGVLNMLQKASKVMQTVQQMAPMLKLLVGSFGKKASTAVNDEGDAPRVRRRRKRRRKGRRRRRR
jgi:hypothetical protein